MPKKALATLEYEKVIERLERRCYTERGRALAVGLTPSPDYVEVLHRQRLTADTRRLIELKPNLSLSDVHDVGGVVEAAALGRQLEPQELLDVRVTLDAARMTINAKVGGRLQVRVLDARDKPPAGFDWSDCAPIQGDHVAHPVQWKGVLGSLRGKQVRLEFALDRAQLYSFDLE